MATGNKYTNSHGTDADYFGDVLSAKGIGTSYIGANSAIDSLANQQPVIMLGQDASNTSKVNSPFGPNPHYVLGRGLDNQGNVIVEDPEMNKPTKYKLNRVIGSLKAAIGAGKGPGLFGKGSGKFDSRGSKQEEIPDNETTKAVYKWLVSNGYSPEAAAGIMGNMWQESGLKPTKIQKYYGTDMSVPNSNPYSYGPAAGIVQWENWRRWKVGSGDASRFGNLVKYAQKMGTDWTDLDTQLAFMNKEMPEIEPWLLHKYGRDASIAYGATEPITLDQFKNLKDTEAATNYFCAAFERCKIHNSNIVGRRDAARGYYELYSGLSNLNSKEDTERSTSSFKTTGSNRWIIKSMLSKIIECKFHQERTAKEKYCVKIQENKKDSSGNAIVGTIWSEKQMSGQMYHVIIKDKYSGKEEEYWTKDYMPTGRIKIIQVQLDSQDTSGASDQKTYGLKYSDGKWYKCRNKSGITKVEFIHTEGNYYITYADGSHEKSKVAPSKDDYPQTITSQNVNDSKTTIEYDEEYNENTASGGTILDRLMNIFSTSMNAAMSGEDVVAALNGLDLTSGSSYSSGSSGSSSSSGGSNHIYTGPTITADSFGTTNDPLKDKKLELVNNALKAEKTQIYTQSSKRTQSGYSDCSEFARRMYKNTFGINIGGWTVPQWDGAKDGTSPMTLIDDNKGNRPDASKLLPGDLIYWYTKGHRGGDHGDVSHVEIYAGNGKLIGQDAGEGKYGPLIKNYASYRTTEKRNYLGATRYLGEKAGKGSGLFGKASKVGITSGTEAGNMDSVNINIQKAINGDVDAYKGLSSRNRKIVDMLRKAISMNNTENYSQDLRDYKGYSDCSKFVGRMYRDFMGVPELVEYNTQGQVQKLNDGKIKNMKMMSFNDGDRSKHLKDLQPGDILYFKTKGWRGGDDGDVSHVELYAGNNMLVGQDGVGPGGVPDKNGELQGTGPTYRSFKDEMYRDVYFTRPQDTSSKEPCELYDRYLGFARYTGTGSGLSDN